VEGGNWRMVRNLFCGELSLAAVLVFPVAVELLTKNWVVWLAALKTLQFLWEGEI